MILIVDTNIVFAALLRDCTTRELLVDSPFALYAPESMLDEIRKYAQEIIKRAGYTEEEFEILFNLIADSIEIVEIEQYSHKLQEADQLIGQIDKGDVPFLALALSIPNNGIWTQNAKHFEKQKKVKVWTTEDLLGDFKSRQSY